MTTFQTDCLAALAPFSACDTTALNYIEGRLWVWLHKGEADYRKARAAVARFPHKVGRDKTDIMVYAPDGTFAVWVHITTAPR